MADGRDGRGGRRGADAAGRAVGAVALLVFTALNLQAARAPAPVSTVGIALLWAAAALAAVRLGPDPHPVRLSGGTALVYNRRTPAGPVRVLRQGGVFQSATYLDDRRFEPVFAYQRALDAALARGDGEAPGSGARRALALGGGGYAWPKWALTRHADLELDVVEIDSRVTEAARRWFFLDELERLAGARLHLVCADGRDFMERLAPRIAAGAAEPYDAVVNDTFRGSEPVRALATVEAARAARSCLAPGGVYVQNVVSRGEGTDLSFLRDEVATLSAVFRHVMVAPVPDEEWAGEDNYIVFATDGGSVPPGAVPFDGDFPGEPLRD